MLTDAASLPRDPQDSLFLSLSEQGSPENCYGSGCNWHSDQRRDHKFHINVAESLSAQELSD